MNVLRSLLIEIVHTFYFYVDTLYQFIYHCLHETRHSGAEYLLTFNNVSRLSRDDIKTDKTVKRVEPVTGVKT